MPIESILIIIVLIVAILGAGLYFLNKWASTKMAQQQDLVEKNKQTVSIYVIDKKKDNIKNVNLPKVVKDNVPKTYKFIKTYFIQAKVGPQIITLMCDKKVFNAIPVKKSVKVDLAGIYIVSVKGMKSDSELKEIKKDKKEKAKIDKKVKKDNK